MSQYATFQDRIDRIQAKQQFIADGLVVGAQARREEPSERLIWLGDVVGVVTLFLAGIMTVFAVRLGRHQWFGAERGDLTSLESVIVDSTMSVFVAVLIFAYVKIHSPFLYAIYGLGAMLCYLCMHMLVHVIPELWAQVFSLKWVYLVLQKTDPNAVLQLQF